MTDKVATAEEALAKMAAAVDAIDGEAGKRNLMFKMNKFLTEAQNLKALPEEVRAEIVAEWLAKEDGNEEIRKDAAAAVEILPAAEAEAPAEAADGKPTVVEAEAAASEDDGKPEIVEPTEAEIDAWLETLSEKEIEELAAEIEAAEADAEDDLPEEFYDAIADLSDEELEVIGRYMAEAEKLDAAAGESMQKADAMADVWLDRGDEDLKKFIGAAMGAMRSAGAFSRAIAGRAGATFGVGASGLGARRSAAAGVMQNRFGLERAAASAGVMGRGMMRRSNDLARNAYLKTGNRQRRNRAIAGAAIGTGVLGGGGALMASRRRGE